MIAGALKKFELTVEGTRGFEFAQISTGGAVTAEFNAGTLMSEKVPGLFACGEILDVDGIRVATIFCGRFHLDIKRASVPLAI